MATMSVRGTMTSRTILECRSDSASSMSSSSSSCSAFSSSDAPKRSASEASTHGTSAPGCPLTSAISPVQPIDRSRATGYAIAVTRPAQDAAASPTPSGFASAIARGSASPTENMITAAATAATRTLSHAGTSVHTRSSAHAPTAGDPGVAGAGDERASGGEPARSLRDAVERRSAARHPRPAAGACDRAAGP